MGELHRKPHDQTALAEWASRRDPEPPSTPRSEGSTRLAFQGPVCYEIRTRDGG
jgi:hypothetical protein